MKICILTQPLFTNYGGLLQAFALQTVLKRMGHEVRTEDRKPNNINRNFNIYIKCIIKRILSFIPFQKRFYNLPSITEEQRLYIRQNTDLFIKKYITTTEPIHTTDKIQFEKYGFDAYVVGSDQVWRPVYSYGLENYFLDFTIGKKVKRIAYAASFGVDDWEFSLKQTKRCSNLAKNFDLVTVREYSGIELCKKYLGVMAEHVLDPTMLLNKEDYESIVISENEKESPGNLFCYILDDDYEKQNIIKTISRSCNLTPFKVMPNLPFTSINAYKHLDDCIFPRVTQWLRAFMDAKMVITDSFHGCVFSIIFNKPFWVIGNKERGMARFNSLLTIFGLESRLLSPKKIEFNDFSSYIDWDQVNIKRKEWQEKSYKLLFNSLIE